MAGSVNKVILIGHLGRDPEVRHLEHGATVGNFPIATSETYTDRATGEKKESTDWHDVVVWRGLADIAEKYLRKGVKVYVEGKLKKRSWQDKEGNTRYSVEVVADELTILSRAESSDRNIATNQPYSSEGTPPPPSPMTDMGNESIEDVLPF